MDCVVAGAGVRLRSLKRLGRITCGYRDTLVEGREDIVRVLDCSAQLNPTAITQARAAGFQGFVRYVHRNQGLTQWERDLIWSFGLDVASVFESTGSSGMGGYNVGVAEAQAAIAGHLFAGGPKGVVIWTGAFDFDCRNPAGAQGYIDGYCNTCREDGYLGGIYGPWGLGQNTHGWDAWWQTMSTGFWNNGYTNSCTMSQHFPQPVFGGIQFDENDVHDINKWGGFKGSITPPPPAKKKGEKVIVFNKKNGAIFTSNLVTFRWVNGDGKTESFYCEQSGPVAVPDDDWRHMGVPADQRSAEAAGAPWPPMAG